VRRILRANGLSLFFGALFLLTLGAQALAGFHDLNERQVADGAAPVSFGTYVTSSDFGVDVAENWQSEYLQFALFILATIWLVQRGSTESKPVGDEGAESDEEQYVGRHAKPDSPAPARSSGPRLWWYSNSLGLLMGVLFLASWTAQAVAGRAAHNAQQLKDVQDPVGFWEYIASPDFWNRTLQNWQSEFLAILSMAVFSIYLRQRGSPESKPVGSPHSATGVEG
jgi:hypothetical protein